MAIKGMSEDIVDALNFDPFEAIESEGSSSQPASQPQPAGGQPESKPVRGQGGRFTADATRVARVKGEQQTVQPAPSGNLPPAGSPAAQPAGAPGANSVAELMSRLKDVPGFTVTPSPAATPQPQPGGSPTQPAAGGPRTGYDYSKPWADQKVEIPAQLVDAIFSEDRNVAMTGMNVLVNTIYNSLMADIHTRVAEAMHTIPRMGSEQTELAVARNALKTKFYGRWPELGDPVGMQTVYSLATNIANVYQQTGQQFDPNSDEFIEYVGDQAMRVLGRASAQKQPRRQFATGGAARESGGGDNPFMAAIGMA